MEVECVCVTVKMTQETGNDGISIMYVNNNDLSAKYRPNFPLST